MNHDDDKALFMQIISKAFIDSNQEPISLPQSVFDEKGLSFDKVNKVINELTSEEEIVKILNRPNAWGDETPYKFALTPEQKETYKKIQGELDYLRDLQMLMIYFGRICMIYDAITGGYVGFEDGQLNRMYTLLAIRIDKILAKDGFAELSEQKPFIHDSLMGIFEELDMEYEFMRPQLWGFYGQLERAWLEKTDGLGGFEISEDEQKLIDKTDKLIKEHEETKRRKDEHFVKQLEQNALEIRENVASQANFTKDNQNEQSVKKNADRTKNRSKSQTSKPKKIVLDSLEPEHYRKRKGVLVLTPDVKVAIAKHGNPNKSSGGKYLQCRLMECVFKDVNTMKSGVKFSRVLGVNSTKIGKNEEKKIRNIVQEINKKISEVGGPGNLIKIQNQKVFVNNSYLE